MHGVEFAADGSFAYRRDELLVPERFAEVAAAVIARIVGEERPAGPKRPPGPSQEASAFGWVRFRGVDDLTEVITALRRRGVPAQPNHVVFATCGCGCGPGHPSRLGANPFYANPFYANPFYANPFYANPFYANPFYANPFYANPNPARLQSLDVDRLESSARPADPPQASFPSQPGSIRVLVLDTGFSVDGLAPQGLVVNTASHRVDQPDLPEDPDDSTATPDGYLDPAAGHGTFIAGVIAQLTDACDITVQSVLSSFGVGDEEQVAKALEAALALDPRPEIINLSFGGYTAVGMGQLADAVSEVTAAGIVVVASAGNDATCVPLYPAAFPGVVSVGAVDDQDHPAPFTNYGPWVRACTLGVDVVSAFFQGWDGDEQPPSPGEPDPDDFDGWARWSGTSFAAPRVVAVLADWLAQRRQTVPHADPYEAVEALIDDPERMRLPMLGTLVKPSGDHWLSVRAATERRQP